MPRRHDGRQEGYELAQYLDRHCRRPTQYTVNDGKLVIDERVFENYCRDYKGDRCNAVIYNAPGATLWIEYRRQRDEHYYHDSGSADFIVCLRCRRRPRRCGQYCSECVSVRLVKDREKDRCSETIVVDNRRYVEYPEKRKCC
ncbi:hypothetical protein GGR57DRAFT_474580 [Xylariaceae sp. FL1272]|nr:hypothetical protein GGR57DRAFT_474580 [Xylariaceae sp. FL1272]